MGKVIAVGALGGSGTRALGQVLIDSGVYIGDYLNKPNDNLLFTRLMINPNWIENASEDQIDTRFDIFKSYMIHGHIPVKYIFETLKAGSNPSINSSYKYYWVILKKLLSKKQKPRTIWGWKEPNNQILIEQIVKHFNDVYYVHVLRHGLDMAFSGNKRQLRHWGYKFDIQLNGEESNEELAVKQLDYWIRSTKQLLEKSSLVKHFYLLNHSNFCQNPKEEIDSLLGFLDITVDSATLKALYEIPQIPSTTGRYRDYNLSIFRKDQLAFVQEMGFVV
jgi:hypothetical protein